MYSNVHRGHAGKCDGIRYDTIDQNRRRQKKKKNKLKHTQKTIYFLFGANITMILFRSQANQASDRLTVKYEKQ